jgi:hypothetical protein
METNQNGNIKKEKIPPHPNIKYKENYQKFKVLVKKKGEHNTDVLPSQSLMQQEKNYLVL